jgi:hypothetical protein
MQGLVYRMILIDRWPLADCSFTNVTLLMQAISVFSFIIDVMPHTKQGIIAISTRHLSRQHR